MIFFPLKTDHKYQNIIIMYGKYFLGHYLEKEIVDTQLGKKRNLIRNHWEKKQKKQPYQTVVL